MKARVLDLSDTQASDFIKERLATAPSLLAEAFLMEGVSSTEAGDYFAVLLFSPDDTAIRLVRRTDARTKLTDIAKKVYGANYKGKLPESIINKCEAAGTPGTFRVAYFHEGKHEGGCGSAVFVLDGAEIAEAFDGHQEVVRRFNKAWPGVLERVKKVVIPPTVSSATNVEATLMAASYVFDEVSRVGGDAATISYLIGLHSRGNKTVRALLERMSEALRGRAYSGELQDFGAEWMKQGFPKLEIGHKLAATLAMTDVPDEIEVLAPWKAWSLVVPPGLFGEKPGEETYARIFCRGAEPAFFLLNTGELLGPFTRQSYFEWHKEQLKKDGTDRTTAGAVMGVVAAIDSLIRGACLALSNPEDYKKSTIKSKEHSSSKKSPREHDVPDFSVSRFMLSAPVEIDVREQLVAFVSGKKKSGGGAPTVQFFVRGHWKQQAHGPQRSLRKTIRIEGFWKGPAHGAIKLGNYKVKKDDET